MNNPLNINESPQNKIDNCVISLIDINNAFKLFKGPEYTKRIEFCEATSFCSIKRVGGKLISPQSVSKLILTKND